MPVGLSPPLRKAAFLRFSFGVESVDWKTMGGENLNSLNYCHAINKGEPGGGWGVGRYLFLSRQNEVGASFLCRVLSDTIVLGVNQRAQHKASNVSCWNQTSHSDDLF